MRLDLDLLEVPSNPERLHSGKTLKCRLLSRHFAFGAMPELVRKDGAASFRKPSEARRGIRSLEPNPEHLDTIPRKR